MRAIAYWLAVILIFIIPWEDSVSIPGMGSLAKLVGLVVSAFWAATILLEGRFRKPHFFYALVLIFFLWNFVSVFWSPDIVSTIQRIKTYSQIFLLMLVFWEVFQKSENLMMGLQAYIYGSYVLIASTIYNYLNGNVSVAYEGRYSATGVNAVDLALILIMGLPVAMRLFFAARQGKREMIFKLINLAYIPSAIFAIILTGSRTSLIAVIPFGIYLFLTQQIKFDRKILVFGALLVLLLALLPLVPQTIITRLGTLGASIEAGDLGGRVDLWRDGIGALAEHPILGVGGGAINYEIGAAVHNTFISVATETGFIGFLLFLSILGLVVYKASMLPGNASEMWLALFMTWAIGVLSLSWEFRKITWIMLSFVIIESCFGKQADEQDGNVNFSEGIKRSFEEGKSASPSRMI
jgi:O-antigen ligase